MPTPVDVRGDRWTYGCEHELADWDVRLLPPGFARSPDHTVVNTNGVAAQPDVRVYGYGGEVNTPPTDTPERQATLLRGLVQGLSTGGPPPAVNHRSNLHVHVRVPGLKNSLPHLKRVQEYVHWSLPKVLDLLEPIPPGDTPASRRRARRRKVSHHTFLTGKRLAEQLAAPTVDQFFRREVPADRSGRPLWHAQPRCCVNLRQLLQTDTVEFRHFPGTLNGEHLVNCVNWCRDFLLAALSGRDVLDLWSEYSSLAFPEFPSFDEEREVGYQATTSGVGLTREEIRANIAIIVDEGWEAFRITPAYRAARQRAGAVPR